MTMFAPMTTHGMAEAKNRLSDLIDRAFAGEAVTITRRGGHPRGRPAREERVQVAQQWRPPRCPRPWRCWRGERTLPRFQVRRFAARAIPPAQEALMSSIRSHAVAAAVAAGISALAAGPAEARGSVGVFIGPGPPVYYAPPPPPVYYVPPRPPPGYYRPPPYRYHPPPAYYAPPVPRWYYAPPPAYRYWPY
jgi:hypothetical protein